MKVQSSVSGQAHSLHSGFIPRTQPEGQALLEVLVALAVGIVIVSAFVSLGAISVRNSTFSSNQARATQLAEEGVEAMISIRDQNTLGSITIDGTQRQWTDLFSGAVPPMNCALAFQSTCSSTDFVLSPCVLNLISQQCIENTSTWQLAAPNNVFSRKIRITDPVPFIADIKDVTVYVWWTDSSGVHVSQLSRKLYRSSLQ